MIHSNHVHPNSYGMYLQQSSSRSFSIESPTIIKSTVAQCSKWYEISDMEIFQITEENPDPPTNQGAYFNILLSI